MARGLALLLLLLPWSLATGQGAGPLAGAALSRPGGSPPSIGPADAATLHREVLRHTPPYRDGELQRYLDGVAARVIASSAWRAPVSHPVTLLDEPAPRAFSLAPGLIYLHRGLLPYLGSEAELAGVIAIEVAHLAAGEGRTAAAAGLLGAVRALTRDLLGAGPAPAPAENALARLEAARRGHAPERELAAALRAIGYLARAGYEPAALPELLAHVQQADRAFNRRFSPAISTRGYPPTRALARPEALQRALRQARAGSRQTLGEINREGYLSRIEGIPVGPRVEEGVLRGPVFLHRGLDAVVRFPSRWHTANLADRVLSLHPAGRALVQLTVAEHPPGSRLDGLLSRRLGVALDGARYDPQTGALRATGPAATPFGERPARYLVRVQGGYAFIFGLVTRGAADLGEFDDALAETAFSLSPLGETGRRLARSPRVAVVRVDGQSDWGALVRRHGLPVGSAGEMALLNGARLTEPPGAGALVKLAR